MDKLLALSGFLALGLSPSFIDWRQSEGGDRKLIIAYYAVAIFLIYAGLWGYDAKE